MNINISTIEKIAEKYQNRVEGLKGEFKPDELSNFQHITSNRLVPISGNMQLIRDKGCSWEELKPNFVGAMIYLKRYLNLLKKFPVVFREPEMKHEKERYCKDISLAMFPEELAEVGCSNACDFYIDQSKERLENGEIRE